MKKTIVYFALLFALVLVGCSTQQDEVLKIDENQQSSTFKFRSISEAIDIAKKATSLLPSSSRSSITVDEKNVIVIRSTTNSRSGEADTLLYAINNEGGEGFTLVSAPQNVEPIIAITENGSYGSVETEQNENFQYALSAAKDYVIEKLNSTKEQ
jgi:PBP1b-binding outer membrane lipoprotein LpoB